jgi:hypothetical protein
MFRRMSAVFATLVAFSLLAGESSAVEVKFGITADDHIEPGASTSKIAPFFNSMKSWHPAFAIDLGDFAVHGTHDEQLGELGTLWGVYKSNVPAPVYDVLGNHDAGWLKGGDEIITAADLAAGDHHGGAFTKAEARGVTGMPNRYYSFDLNGFHFIVLDGNNYPVDQAPPGAPPTGHDGVVGMYYLDPGQLTWLAADLAANRSKQKVVFAHQELHHTPPEGSGDGGDVPFKPLTPHKETSYIDNGWQARELFKRDGRVIACFAGHQHVSRWTVYGNTNYFTLAANHLSSAYTKVTISADILRIEGVGQQKSYQISLPGTRKRSRPQ